MQVLNFTIEDHERKRAKAKRTKKVLKDMVKGQDNNVTDFPSVFSIDTKRKLG